MSNNIKRKNQATIKTTIVGIDPQAVLDLTALEQANGGVYFLSGTEASSTGIYYGFTVVTETVIDSITYIDSTKQVGDITAITWPAGMYVRIPGGFSTITLTSGDLILLKN